MTTLLKWSIQDYHHLIASGILCNRRVELLRGDIIAMSPEGPLHSSISSKTVKYLRSHLENLAEVREGHPITLSDSEPEPDIAVVRLPDSRYDQRHPDPEDILWLIEIADTTLAYDLNKKKQTYAAAQIPEYWVIDVQAQQLTLFQKPEGATYGSRLARRQGMIAPLAFPQIQLSVERLCRGG